MSLELFDKIIQQVCGMTEQVCLHLMGDPLVHPKLEEFIDICEKHQTPIYLVTNGVLLKDRHLSMLLKPSLRQVNFSLHSFPDNFPQKDPKPYLDKIFAFTELAFEKRPDLYINYRLWNLDQPQGSNSNNLLMLDLIQNQYGFKFNKEIDVTIQKSHLIKNRLYLHFDTEFIWPDLNLPVLGKHGSCYGLKSHFGILADGTVVPCCLDKEGKIPLGNANDEQINDILSSQRATNILNGFRNKKLLEDLCQRCQYIERFQ